ELLSKPTLSLKEKMELARLKRTSTEEVSVEEVAPIEEAAPAQEEEALEEEKREDADPEYTEYLKLLEKERAVSLKLLEKIKLNKLKVKYAPIPMDFPSPSGEIKVLDEEKIELQD